MRRSSEPRTAPPPRRRAAAALAAGVLALAACQPAPEASTSKAAEDNAIVQEKERGPVKLTLRVEPKEPSFAERIHYTLTASAEAGVDVFLPAAGEAVPTMGDAIDATKFIIRDFQALPEAARAGGRYTRGQTYTLEVIASGDYVLPAATVTFIDRRPRESPGDGGAPAPEAAAPAAPAAPGDGAGGSERVFKLESDPITIHVKPIEDAGAAAELEPIEGPIEPPRIPPSLRWPLIVLGSACGLAGLVVLASKLRRARSAAAPALPPEEVAYRELEWLLAQGFVERDELKEFFFHISRIVREYIEARFGLKAPERTTEEFLEELARSDALSEAHKRSLRRFLEQADLVKFAKYAPGADEVGASFEAAKAFILETRRAPEESADGPR
jgi:hypothetical protein